MLPASIAIPAALVINFVLFGANTESVAISMPIVPKFEKPHSA